MSDQMKKANCWRCGWLLSLIHKGEINIRSDELYVYVKGDARIICKGCGAENKINSEGILSGEKDAKIEDWIFRNRK
jgi:RNase P subunit RPR2